MKLRHLSHHVLPTFPECATAGSWGVRVQTKYLILDKGILSGNYSSCTKHLLPKLPFIVAFFFFYIQVQTWHLLMPSSVLLT